MSTLDELRLLVAQGKNDEACSKCLFILSSPPVVVDFLRITTDSFGFSPSDYEKLGEFFLIVAHVHRVTEGRCAPLFRSLLESVYYPYIEGVVREQKREAYEALESLKASLRAEAVRKAKEEREAKAARDAKEAKEAAAPASAEAQEEAAPAESVTGEAPAAGRTDAAGVAGGATAPGPADAANGAAAEKAPPPAAAPERKIFALRHKQPRHLACFHVALSTLSLLAEMAGIASGSIEDFIVSMYILRVDAAHDAWVCLRSQAGDSMRRIDIAEKTSGFGFPITEAIYREELQVWAEFAVVLLASRGDKTLATPLERASPILPAFLDRLEQMGQAEQQGAAPVAGLLLSLHSGCLDYPELERRVRALGAGAEPGK